MISYFLKAASLRTWLNTDRSKVKSFPAFFVTMDAALGALYIRAN